VVDVVFAYPTRAKFNILNGYSLRVEAGQMVALCGPSGSGKSTIISLIERFYDPQSGMLTLDGVDIKTLNVRWLRSQLGLVGQEPVLFVGTVAENIAYGKPGATREEVQEAATMANAHDFVVAAGGYDAPVGERGGSLSGGQRQRLAIARALLRAPRLLLLDEATSALDGESERAVQSALGALHGTTALVVAHRLSTVRTAATIHVLQDGRVVESGTHDALRAAGGLYSRLAAGDAHGEAVARSCV